MKKLMYIAAALLVLVGCNNKENVIENTPQNLVTITGGIDFSAQDGPNKVVAKEGWEDVTSGNQVEFMWEEGDKIAIVNEDMTEIKQFTVTSISEDKQTATFTGEPLSGGMESYYAIYPYELGVAAMQQGGKDAFFANQQYTGKLRPAVQGPGTNDSFTLDWFFPVIDLSLKGSVKLGKIVYHVDNDGHGNPYDATLSFGDGGLQLTNEPQHVTFIPCVLYAQGFTLSFYDTDNQLIMEKKSEKSITSVGGIASFPTLEVKATPTYVDLGLSVRWATMNVGATKPEEYGDHFAWGETEPYYITQSPLTWKTNKIGYNWQSYCGADEFTEWNTVPYDANGVLKPDFDVATVKWGGTWRMPTGAEIEELMEKCTFKWTYDYKGTGVPGKIVTGPNDESFFLPADGDYTYIDNGTTLLPYDILANGCSYWCSTLDYVDPSVPYSAHNFIVEESDYEVFIYPGASRCYGYLVRPVCPIN